MKNKEGLTSPNPGKKLTRLLAWLKKRGGIKELSKCKKKASQIGISNLENEIKTIPNTKIMLGIIPKGDRNKGIYIKDKGWADGWAKYYDLEIPHHRHHKKL